MDATNRFISLGAPFTPPGLPPGAADFLLFVMYGLFYSIDEAQSKAFIADLEPERRATAIGVYNSVTGLLYLPASLIAGALWATHPNTVFILAAMLSLTAIGAFLLLRPAPD